MKYNYYSLKFKKSCEKSCLLRLQKGVSKSSKGHLLQAKRALIGSQLTPLLFLRFDFYLQYGGGQRKEVNIILGKKTSVDGVVLTPLTPFNSLTPRI